MVHGPAELPQTNFVFRDRNHFPIFYIRKEIKNRKRQFVVNAPPTIFFLSLLWHWNTYDFFFCQKKGNAEIINLIDTFWLRPWHPFFTNFFLYVCFFQTRMGICNIERMFYISKNGRRSIKSTTVFESFWEVLILYHKKVLIWIKIISKTL